MSFTNWLITKYFRQKPEIIIHLGPGPAVGTLFVNMPTKQFWNKEDFFKRLICIIKRKWIPNELYLKQAAGEILAVEVFGSDDDYGEQLYKNIVWYYHKEWKVDSLTEKDLERAEAMDGMTLHTRIRLGKDFIPMLALQLGKRSPMICGLTHMMLVKIPVISFQFYLDIDCRFTFHSIRKADHPQANDLIAYLYELLFLQQKIAISFHEFLLQVHAIDKIQDPIVFSNSRVDAIMKLDQAITYLKSSIEKTTVLVGLIFGVNGLDGMVTHKKRLTKLLPVIPIKVKNNYYFELIADFISTENLETLNNYRTGLLHKKGISDLQPHSHYGENKDTVRLKEIFHIMHEQHAKGTAVLLCTLAVLTDDLVERDKPEIDPMELLSETNDEFRRSLEEFYVQHLKEKVEKKGQEDT